MLESANRARCRSSASSSAIEHKPACSRRASDKSVASVASPTTRRREHSAVRQARCASLICSVLTSMLVHAASTKTHLQKNMLSFSYKSYRPLEGFFWW